MPEPVLRPRIWEARGEVRVEALRGVGVQSDVQRVRVVALLDQAYPLRTAHHLARKHPVRFVMLVVYAAGLLFIFLMKRQD